MHVDPNDHLALVHYWAKRYARTVDDRDDVAQMGMLGLMRACERFDPSRGVAFSTYASVAIQQSIMRELKRTQPFFRVPEKWTIDQRIPVTSLNRPVRAIDDDDGAELGDLVPDERAPTAGDGAAANELRDRLRAVLRRLPQRDRQVLELRHGVRDDGSAGHAMTLDEVASLLRISRERVRQLEERATARVRRRLTA